VAKAAEPRWAIDHAETLRARARGGLGNYLDRGRRRLQLRTPKSRTRKNSSGEFGGRGETLQALAETICALTNEATQNWGVVADL
jgi:hypothetical protein